MINKNYIEKKYNDPFPYIVFENFFEKDFFEQLKNDFPPVENLLKAKNNIGRMHHDITNGDKVYDELIKKSYTYKKIHDYIYSKNFINFFLNMFKDPILLNIEDKNLIYSPFDFKIQDQPYENIKVIDKNSISNYKKKILYSRLDIGVGKKNYGVTTGGGGIHVDNPQRLISLLFYFGGYSYMKGGEHRIWKENNEKMQLTNIINPIPNMMIASLQTNVSYHDVNPIQQIDGSRNAFYLAISSSVKIWKNVEYSKFNMLYNKNRCKKTFFKKLIDLINV